MAHGAPLGPFHVPCNYFRRNEDETVWPWVGAAARFLQGKEPAFKRLNLSFAEFPRASFCSMGAPKTLTVSRGLGNSYGLERLPKYLNTIDYGRAWPGWFTSLLPEYTRSSDTEMLPKAYITTFECHSDNHHALIYAVFRFVRSILDVVDGTRWWNGHWMSLTLSLTWILSLDGKIMVIVFRVEKSGKELLIFWSRTKT